MKVIVCGAGRVGYGIARELAQERNAVTVIDLSPELIDNVTTNLDVRGVVGHGGHPDVLARAGARDAEMIIAVTFSDEVNMVACQVAHSLFDVPTKIARIRSQSYLEPEWQDLFSRQNLPIDVIISPEVEVGRAIIRRLETPGAFDTLPFADGRVLVIGIRLDETCPVIDTPLAQLTDLFPHLQATVIGVRREERLFVPRPSDQLAAGDSAYVCVEAGHVARTLDIFGREETRARRLVIVGGGNIGIFLAQALERISGLRVRVIEADKHQAEVAAAALRRTVVLHGDGLDPAILREAGADEAEVVICLTNDDKVNVLAAALAKAEGARRSLSLFNDRRYLALKSALDVDVFVDPRATTVSTILQHVRKGRITGLHSIEDGEAEVLEGVALETSPLVGKPLGKVELSDGIAIGAIMRDDKVWMPRKDFRVEAGDRLVIFAERADVAKVEKLFRVALEFF